MRSLAVALGLVAFPVSTQAAVPSGSARPPAFQGSIQPLRGPLRARVAAHLWHPGCPVGISALRVLSVSYQGFDSQVHSGRLVVNAAAAHPLLTVFRRMYRLRFSIRHMQPLGGVGDDTAAFDCRDASPSPFP